MANPNIINLTEYFPGLSYVTPTVANTSSVLISNAANSGTAVKINSVIATNKSIDNVEVIVAINTNSAGTGTSYNLAYKIVVPFGASLQVLEKGSGIYLTENISLIVSSAVASAIDFVGSYEVFK